MALVWDGKLSVQYHFAYLSPADAEDPDLDEAIEGQVNGLLGARVPGALALNIGLHTGPVPVRIEWDDVEPAIDPGWEDVVEVGVDVGNRNMRLAGFDDAHPVVLPAAGPHRARLCASGMDAAAEQDSASEDEPAPDRYLLQLWPAPPAADRVVRAGSRYAQRCHAHAAEGSGASEEDEDDWTPYSEEERRTFRDLPPGRRSEVKAVMAHMACEYAGVADIEPLRSALAAIDRGQPMPAAMADPRAVSQDIIATLQPRTPGPGSPVPPMQPVVAAVQAVFAASRRPNEYPRMTPPPGISIDTNQDLLSLLLTVKTAADRTDTHDATVVRELRGRLG